MTIAEFERALDTIDASVETFSRIVSSMVLAEVLPLIKSELGRVRVRSGRLKRSGFIKVARARGRIVLRFGWELFYASFAGADRRRLIRLAESDAFQAAVDRGVESAAVLAGLNRT